MTVESAAARKPCGLPKRSRLKLARDFARLKAGGRRLVCGSLILNWLPAKASGESRLGVVTGRAAGSAVERNRARRLLREVWRRSRSALTQPLDVVLVARPSIRGKAFAAVQHDFHTALRRAGLRTPHESD